MNLRERLAAALEARGEARNFNAVSRKYWTFSRKEGGQYYLGSSGALRAGPTIKGSLPVNQTLRNQLLGGKS